MTTQRLLPEAVCEKLSRFPEYRMGAHKVAVRLRDGRVIEDVVVAWEKEIIRVGDSADIPFSTDDVVDVMDRS